MPTSPFCRAGAARIRGGRAAPSAAFADVDLDAVARTMLPLMLRNVASDGFVLADLARPGRTSRPGCIIAAPSYPVDLPGDEQDYVFNWVRDAAIVTIEIAEAGLLPGPDGSVPALGDYVRFARLCQERAAPTPAHACFTIDGWPRPWSEQSDGPALQTLACMRMHDQLGADDRAVAREVVDRNLRFLLGAYREPTTNLWEEHEGFSFFARAVQLRCFDAVASNRIGLPIPDGLDEAQAWLRKALAAHWDGTRYLSLLARSPGGDAARPASAAPDYDPNIDVVCAAIYGQVPASDTRLLATAAQLRRQWADPGSEVFYPINGVDREKGIGPMLGRYPGDRYDGDLQDSKVGGHPWALCTSNFAELHFRLGAEITSGGQVPLDELSRPFFADIGVTEATPHADAVEALLKVGEAMLRAVIHHSDNYELSEQFDGTTGLEKSLRNLSWSYAAFLSAVRSRRAVAGIAR